MDDLNLITKIAAAGSMGVSIFLIIKVYNLLKREQDQSNPRPVFIRTIYRFMIFAVLMTLLSLGIEVVRNFLTSPCEDLRAEMQKLTNDLDDIAGQETYAVDRFGNPKPIRLKLQNKDYILVKAFPSDHFKNNELKMILGENHRLLVVRSGTDGAITFGYIDPRDPDNNCLKSYTDNAHSASADELFTLGYVYAPQDVACIVPYNIRKDNYISIKYLTELICQDDIDDISLQVNAIKLLTQRELVKKLSDVQYDALIEVLLSGIREIPYNKYELAQVYLNRSWSAKADSEKQGYLDHYKQYLEDYVAYYEGNSWIRDQEKYPREHEWYVSSLNELKNLGIIASTPPG